MPFDATMLMHVHANKSGMERRAGELSGRRTVKKDNQAAWLLRSISCIDLTTLSGDDTPGNVRRLCAKAKNPLRKDIREKLGLSPEFKLTTGAVCVYPARVKDAVEALAGSGIPVASVATGFPSGQIKTSHKLAEIEQCVADGAREIDIVLSRDLCLRGEWEAVYDEVKLFKEACGPNVEMKTILATGELATFQNVYKASLVCMMAGADFIKTSTGKENVNATIPVSLCMMRAIREYHGLTDGYRVGYKPAGGISTAKDSCNYLALVKEELGDTWLNNDMFRFGASSLLNDCERQLYHHAFGEYAADYYMPSA
jgi:deoxyribose-phosphate aldolase